MRRAWSSAVCRFAVLLVLCGALRTASAGYPITVDSLELAVADADLVVRGAIVRKTPHGAPVDGEQWYLVEVRVHETLKGPERATITIADHSASEGSAGRPKDREPSKDVLLFLVGADRAAKELERDAAALHAAPFALRAQELARVWSRPVHWIDLTRPLAVVTRDFAVVSDRADLLARVRSSAKRPAVHASHKLDVPPGTAAQAEIASKVGAWLRVPVDAELEKLARTLLAGRTVRERAQGIAAIEHFPSAENIAILERLGTDPAKYVREHAGEVLSRWRAAKAPAK